MVDALPTWLWKAFHAGLVAGRRPHRQDYPKRHRQSLGWPLCQLHQHCLISAAAQNEHRANQYAEKESCFHLKLVPCLIAGPMLAFLLITYQ